MPEARWVDIHNQNHTYQVNLSLAAHEVDCPDCWIYREVLELLAKIVSWLDKG
jgi:hypothetical protein